VSFGATVAVHASATDPALPADSSYKAPARWNNFRQKKAIEQEQAEDVDQVSYGPAIYAAAMTQNIERLPTPTANLLPQETAQTYRPERGTTSLTQSQPMYAPHPGHAPVGGHPAPSVIRDTAPFRAHSAPMIPDAEYPGGNSSCSSCSNCATQPCSSCAAQPHVAPARMRLPAPQAISPWFGGGDLLFWNFEDGSNRLLATDHAAMPLLTTGRVSPGSDVGFDVHFGRYLGCGRYGLDVGYMHWDPGAETAIVSDMGGGLRVANPALRDVSIDRGAGMMPVYDDYDNNAAGLIAVRDIRIQGLEANLNCFGLLGARRLGYGNAGCGAGGLCTGKACGGSIGPMVRPCSGRVRIQALNGFRWFEFQDHLRIGGNVNGMPGYGPMDLYYDIETENNLFGYQFGGLLTYCLGNRTLINLGGKFGIYGNDVTYIQRLGTDMTLAYTNSEGGGAGDLMTESSDTVLAALGELDLGIGYRLGRCWTVRGGYRLLAVSGVATSIGQMPHQYTSAASAGAVRADDSLLLHGAYVGLDYNW
jgi:hypothetical protein